METTNVKVLRMTEVLDAVAWWETLDRALEDYDPFTLKVAMWVKTHCIGKLNDRSQIKDAIESHSWAIVENDKVKAIQVNVQID